MWSIASMSITPIRPMRVVIPTSNPPCHSDRREESASRRHMLTSNPFLSHYHRSDYRHQQQQRRDFEGDRATLLPPIRTGLGRLEVLLELRTQCETKRTGTTVAFASG